MKEVSFFDMRHNSMRSLKEPLFKMLCDNLRVENPTVAIYPEGGDDVNGLLRWSRESTTGSHVHGSRRVSGL